MLMHIWSDNGIWMDGQQIFLFEQQSYTVRILMQKKPGRAEIVETGFDNDVLCGIVHK
jgi:hypothetical protein